MRAKGPRGQDLQGTVEIRRDLRHLWPVRPPDALLHSKPTCPTRSRRCCPCTPPTPSDPSFSAPPTGGGEAPTAVGPTAVATAMVPTVVAPTVRVVAMVATVMAPTVVPTITVDTAVPAMKRCQLDSRLAAAAAVATYHHGRRQHLIAATTELYSRQATEETASPLRLRTRATRIKDISVVLFPPFSVVRNRVLAPLLMFCSSHLPSRASFPTSCLRFSRRNVLALQP